MKRRAEKMMIKEARDDEEVELAIFEIISEVPLFRG